MRSLPHLFENNRAWATRKTRQDPEYFSRLCGLQAPRYLWIGCADSRVPANEIVGLEPGELFVHRNVANLVRADDFNCYAVLEYAIDVLKVTDVIVCGHYGCGGVQAALTAPVAEPIERWIAPIRDLARASKADLDAKSGDEARWRRLCELNVVSQVRELAKLPVVASSWKAKHPLRVHGWIYDLHDGLLRDLDVTLENAG
jgi:carbonic anhydrase